jgi:uncharacterized cupredoxin-like copper-binding protein
MRRTVSLLIALAMFAAAFLPAQAAEKEKKIDKADVPQAVMDAFAKAYPKAKITGTATEKKGGERVFEIESMEGNVTRNVIYKADGTLVEIEEKIPPTALPLAVIQGIKARYPTGETVRAEKITRGDTVEFELRLKQDQDYYELTVSTAGKITNSKKLTHENEEEENEIENE